MSFRRSAVTLILFSFALSSFASSPPPIPAEKLPPAVHPRKLVQQHVAPQPVRGEPLTLERLEQAPISGVAYYAIRAQLRKELGIADDVSVRERDRLDGFTANAVGAPPVNATLDSLQDTEPSVTSVTIGSTKWTSTAAIKHVDSATPRNYFATTSNFSSFTRGELPRPAGYALSGDPLMAVNPYTGGVAPKRMYCVGLLFNPQGGSAPSAIGVWRSDNGGQSWAGPSIVATRAGDSRFVDKPAIAVSWHSGSLGYVYVSYTDLDLNTARNPDNFGHSIRVKRSTDGGLTWSAPFVVSFDHVQGTQLTVNTGSGQVTIIWVNNRYTDIRAAYSNDFGLSFGSHEIISGGNLLTSVTGRIINGNVRAPTLPMARYNWAASRNVVVWHARGGNGTTEVYYSYKPCFSNCNGFGWSNAIQLNDNSTNDQFMPAVDFNTQGNVVVPFYDRREDTVSTPNIEYHEYFAYATVNGANIHGNGKLSTQASNPADNHNTFIGDYQDVWDDIYPTGEMAVSAWAQIINSAVKSETYLSRITY